MSESTQHASPKLTNILENAAVKKGLAQTKALLGITNISEEDPEVVDNMNQLLQIEKEIATVLVSLKKSNAQRKALEASKQNLIESLISIQTPGHFTGLSHEMAECITILERATQIYETSLIKNWEKPLSALLNNEIQLAKHVHKQYQHAKLMYDDSKTAVKNLETKINEAENPPPENPAEDNLQKAKAMFSKFLKRNQTPEDLRTKLKDAQETVIKALRDYDKQKDYLLQVISIVKEKRNTELAVEVEKFKTAAGQSVNEMVKVRSHVGSQSKRGIPMNPQSVQSPIRSDEEP